MKNIAVILLCCVFLTSCSTAERIRDNEMLDKIGSFELNPVQKNTYWYDGKSFEYNEYKIEIISEPARATVELEGKIIGTTPFTYIFSGTVDKGDYLRFTAFPFDESLKAQEYVLHVNTELPRKINFNLKRKP